MENTLSCVLVLGKVPGKILQRILSIESTDCREYLSWIVKWVVISWAVVQVDCEQYEKRGERESGKRVERAEKRRGREVEESTLNAVRFVN